MKTEVCCDCKGNKKKEMQVGTATRQYICHTCNGSGKTIKCSRCRGSGLLKDQECVACSNGVVPFEDRF